MGQNHKNKIKELAEQAVNQFGSLVIEAQINFILVRYSEASKSEARRAIKAVHSRKAKESGEIKPVRTLKNR